MKSYADVIVVGSGIIGNAAAYYLVKNGCAVTVFEKSSHIGNGGSSRNGGGVRQSGRDPRELPLAMYAVENIWPTLSDELEMDIEYFQEGNLRLGKTASHLGILQELTDKANALGLDVRMVSGKEAHGICPFVKDRCMLPGSRELVSQVRH